jgi:hypothetical protein
VLKNSKNPPPLIFSPKSVASEKLVLSARRGLLERHTSQRDRFGRSPGQNFLLALYGEVFHCFSEKTEFFNTISPWCLSTRTPLAAFPLRLCMPLRNAPKLPFTTPAPSAFCRLALRQSIPRVMALICSPKISPCFLYFSGLFFH